MPDSGVVAPKTGGKVAGFFRRIKSRKSLRRLGDTTGDKDDGKEEIPALPSTLPPKLELLDLPVLSGDFLSLSSTSFSGAAQEGDVTDKNTLGTATDDLDGGLASLLQFTSFAHAGLDDHALHSSTDSTVSSAPVCSLDRQSVTLEEGDAGDDYGSASSIGHNSTPSSPKTAAGFTNAGLSPTENLTDSDRDRIAARTRKRLEQPSVRSTYQEPSLRLQLAWQLVSRRLERNFTVNRSFLTTSDHVGSATSLSLQPHPLVARLLGVVFRPAFTERSLVTTASETGGLREDIVRPPRRMQAVHCSQRILGLLRIGTEPLDGDELTRPSANPGARPLREVGPVAKVTGSPRAAGLPTLALNDEELVPMPRPASPQGQVEDPLPPFVPPVLGKRFSAVPQRMPPHKPALPGPLLLDAVVNKNGPKPLPALNSPGKEQSSWTLSDSDDDKPLAVLKQRSSPKRTNLRLSPFASALSSFSPSPSASPVSHQSRSLPHSPSRCTPTMQDQLAEAQQRASQLEAELVRLQRREERRERERQEQEEAAREKERQRRLREQRRRSEAMTKGAKAKEGDCGIARPSRSTPASSAPGLAATRLPATSTNSMLETTVTSAFPASPSYPSFLPVPVLVPMYSPSLQASISSPDLRQAMPQPFLAPPSPVSSPRPQLVNSRSSPALDKRASLIPHSPASVRPSRQDWRRSLQPPSTPTRPLPQSRSTPNVLRSASAAPLPPGHHTQRLPPPRSTWHPQLPHGPAPRR